MSKIVLPDQMTIGKCYGRCAEITDQDEANEYFMALVERNMRICPEHDFDAAIKVEKANIGYFAGYCDSETALRMELLFNTIHPILGSAQNYCMMSAEDIVEVGRKYGRTHTPTPPAGAGNEPQGA